MVTGTKVMHHIHKRKTYEPYPHKDKTKRVVDRVAYIAGMLGPLMAFPQLINIWIYKNASGVSAFSWGAFFIAAIFWLIYGVVHKEKPLIFMYSLWALLDGLIMVGAIIYG